MSEDELQEHAEAYRIAVEATVNMLDKLPEDNPATFYGPLCVILHELLLHAPSLQNAMELLSVAIQNELTEDDFNKYFKKAFRTDPFYASQNRTLH